MKHNLLIALVLLFVLTPSSFCFAQNSAAEPLDFFIAVNSWGLGSDQDSPYTGWENVPDGRVTVDPQILIDHNLKVWYYLVDPVHPVSPVILQIKPELSSLRDLTVTVTDHLGQQLIQDSAFNAAPSALTATVPLLLDISSLTSQWKTRQGRVSVTLAIADSPVDVKSVELVYPESVKGAALDQNQIDIILPAVNTQAQIGRVLKAAEIRALLEPALTARRFDLSVLPFFPPVISQGRTNACFPA